MQHADREDVIVQGWLNGDDYEAALAYRRREPGEDPSERPPAGAQDQNRAGQTRGSGQPE